MFIYLSRYLATSTLPSKITPLFLEISRLYSQPMSGIFMSRFDQVILYLTRLTFIK